MYQIEYKRELSNSDYTQHHVYHIKTEDMNYPHAHKAIESIMNDGNWLMNTIGGGDYNLKSNKNSI